MQGFTYERIKPDAAYIGVGTSFFRPGFTAMGGYNFLISKKDTITPFVGFGFYAGSTHHVFPLVGAGYEHAFNSVFSLGAVVASAVGRDLVYTVGIPCTFHFGEQKKWEFRLTPLLIHNGSGLLTNDTTALSFSFGYRF